MMDSTKKFSVQYIGYTVLTANDNMQLDGLQKHLLALYHEFVKCGGYYPHRLQQAVMSPVWMKFNNTDTTSRKDAKFLYGAIQVWDAVMLRTFKSGGKKVYGIFESICLDQVVGKEKPKNLFVVKDKLHNPKHANVPFVMFIYMPKPKETRLELHLFACQGVEHACEIVNTISYSKSAYVEDYGTLKVDDQLFVNEKPLDNWRQTSDGWRMTATKYPMFPGSLQKEKEAPVETIREHDPSIPNFAINTKSYQYEGRLFSDSAERRRKPDLINNLQDNLNNSSLERARTLATEVEDKVYNGRLARSDYDLGRRGSIQSDFSVNSHGSNDIKVNPLSRRSIDSSEEEKAAPPGTFAETLAAFQQRERKTSGVSDSSSSSPKDVSFSNKEAMENNLAQAESVEQSRSNLPQYMRTGIKVLPTDSHIGLALANRNKLKPSPRSPRSRSSSPFDESPVFLRPASGSRRNSLEISRREPNDVVDEINRRHSMLEPSRNGNYNNGEYLSHEDTLQEDYFHEKENSNPETDSISSTLSRLSTEDVINRMSKHENHQRSKKQAEIDATLRSPYNGNDVDIVETDIEKCLGYLP